MALDIRIATPSDLPQVAPLFDAYRQFYAQPADLPLATAFMRERLEEGSSLVLVAVDASGALVGFTQLYPLFDSVSAVRSFVLYDLYIAHAARRQGAARALMLAAVEEARRRGAGRLELQTARTNIPAQKLYEGLGWARDDDFFVYAFHP
ncbi:GNAT family N-acetyltransferase [Stenotrophomonas sp. GZD-301]|uniref:GNAT family N-acetyltransferase n=1 Tax=Stenotrophomonas sp. GZD-301 TaxID=3404814 RepID=UPI003BB8157B